MKVSTNVTKPKKKKKPENAAGTVRPFKTELEGKTTLSVTPSKTTKTYAPARTHTGHPAYGKENPKNKDAAFIEEGRKKKQDIVHDSEGKPFRAGFTTEKTTPVKLTATTPKIKIIKPKAADTVKPKKSAEEIRGANAPGKTKANPVPWVVGQGGGRGKSEGKHLGNKAKVKIKYKR